MGFGDTTLWAPINTGGADPNTPNTTLSVVPNGFQVSVADRFPGVWIAGYKTANTLHGDFTIETDFALLTWPAGNAVRIGINFLSPSQGAIERTSMGWSMAESYIFDGVGHGQQGTTDVSGRLRLSRAGTTLTGSYLHDGAWVQVGSGTVTTADAVIGLIAWPDYSGGGPAVFQFLNPTLSMQGHTGTTDPEPPGPVIPEPSTLLGGAVLLLPFVGTGLRRIRGNR